MILSLSASNLFAEPDKKTENPAVPGTENKLSEDEINRLTKRVEEIRDMDKSDLTLKERKELKKELRGIKETVKKDGGYIYIGAGTILVILLIVLLVL